MVRLVIAALAASDMGGSDIRRLGEELLRGTETSKLLGSRVRALGKLLEEETIQPSVAGVAGGFGGGDAGYEIMSLIKRRRLSKRTVVGAILATWPEWKDGPGLASRNVEDIVTWFVRSADQAKREHLIELLVGHPRERDDYLKGIMEG
jgi:hypothetical protein